MAWYPGDLIVRREVLGLGQDPPAPVPAWWGRCWAALPVFVVEDSDEALVTYLPEEAPFRFPAGQWPTPDGAHPWAGRDAWSGYGSLMVQRPGDDYAVWHFWQGPDRTFAGWYINLQTAYRRTSIGYDSEDLELDIFVLPDDRWFFKDRDVMNQRIEEGRFSPERVDRILALGDELATEIESGRWWWDRSWSQWLPDPSWRAPRMPVGWDAEPSMTPTS